MAVTNKAIYDQQQANQIEVLKEFGEVNAHLATLNGNVERNKMDIGEINKNMADLPCQAHGEELAVLKQSAEHHSVNWGRIWSVIQAILNFVLLAALAKILIAP